MRMAGPRVERSLARSVGMWLTWLLPLCAAVLVAVFCFYGVVEVHPTGCLIFGGAAVILVRLAVAKALLVYPELPTKLWALLRYRLLQFSLRALLLVTLAFSIVLSCLVMWRTSARAQRQRVAAIKGSGGCVNYDFYLTDRGVPPVPEWLWRAVGVDYFGNVSRVWFEPTGGGRLVVRGLELDQLRHLTSVSFNFTAVGDDDLLQIAELPELRELSLQRTAVTDRGLMHLRGLRKLESLSLYRTKVTDSGLEHLRELTGLRELELWRTQVSDTGLKHLEGLTELRRLDLSETALTDAGLKHVSALTNLETLLLMRTEVGDAGLAHLAGLPKLRQLYLDKTKATPAALNELKKALPRCEVTGP